MTKPLPCPTGKSGYDSRSYAEAALLSIQKAIGTGKHYVYLCPTCRKWHWTQQVEGRHRKRNEQRKRAKDRQNWEEFKRTQKKAPTTKLGELMPGWNGHKKSKPPLSNG